MSTRIDENLDLCESLLADNKVCVCLYVMLFFLFLNYYLNSLCYNVIEIWFLLYLYSFLKFLFFIFFFIHFNISYASWLSLCVCVWMCDDLCLQLQVFLILFLNSSFMYFVLMVYLRRNLMYLSLCTETNFFTIIIFITNKIVWLTTTLCWSFTTFSYIICIQPVFCGKSGEWIQKLPFR